MTPFPSPTTKWHQTTYPSLSPTRPELSAKGKTVLITGGGTGIGAETARYFAAAGASRIAIVGRREAPLVATRAAIQGEFPGVEVFTASVDVTNKAQVDAAFSTFLGDAKLDVLVSNAAIIGSHDAAADADPARFMDGVQANILGALLVAQAFIRHAAADAVAVDVNSSAAHLSFAAGLAAYSVAKLGVFRLWDNLAFAHPELAVYHIQPGVVDTDMNREAGGVKALGYEDHVSLPASFIVWLASPEARFLKNKFLWANWDVDELRARQAELEAGTQLNIGLGGWPFGNTDWSLKWKP